MEFSQARLRALESRLSSCRETGRLLGTSHNRIWLWRRSAANLRKEQIEKLELYLYAKLAQLEILGIRGGGR